MTRLLRQRWTSILGLALLIAGLHACSHEDPTAVRPSAPAQTSPAPVMSKGGTGAEWLVILDEGTTAEDIAAATGWIILSSDPQSNVALFYDDDGSGNPPHLPGVLAIQLNQHDVESDTPWHIGDGFYEGDVEDSYSSEQEELAVFNLEEVHHFYDGSGIRVAIIDTGVDATHRNLGTHLEVASLTPEDMDDAWGHGTVVAGLVAAMAPGAMLLPYDVFGPDSTTSEADIAEALQRAKEDGVDVVNISLRIDSESPAIALKLAELQSLGVFVIAAAGNTDGGDPVFPATDPTTVSFAAVDIHDQIASFSAVGDVDFAAPGVNMLSTYPGDAEYPSGKWVRAWGTSMACAVGSGYFALAVQALGTEHDMAEIIQLVMEDGAPVTPVDAVIGGRINTETLLSRGMPVPPGEDPPPLPPKP